MIFTNDPLLADAIRHTAYCLQAADAWADAMKGRLPAKNCTIISPTPRELIDPMQLAKQEKEDNLLLEKRRDPMSYLPDPVIF
jgi:hypothetical protein